MLSTEPARPARDGWAEAAKKLAAEGGDELVMGEFGNEADLSAAYVRERCWLGCLGTAGKPGDKE